MKSRGLRFVSLFLCLSLCLNFCLPWGVSAKAERATSTRPSSVKSARSSCDRIAPSVVSGYPKVTNLQSRQVSLCLKSNERGKAYFVVLPNNAKVPTAAQVKAGKNASGQAVTALLKGQINLYANKEATVTIKGLVADTSFDIYFVVEDRACNLQSKVTKVDIKTKAIFLSGYPKVSNVQSNQLDLCFKINEKGKVYYVVLPNNAKTPTVTQIKAGKDANCSTRPSSLKGQLNLYANKEARVTIKGLTPATSYDIYLIVTEQETTQAMSWIVKVETKVESCKPPAAPTGLVGVQPTTPKNNNGKITGVNGKMEYKLQSSTKWIEVKAQTTVITDLVPGTYEVRFKAVPKTPASQIALVTVPPYVAPVVNKEITAVARFNDITVDYGTLKGAIGLPTNVTVTLDDKSTKSLAVSWDDGEPAYNGNKAGAYTFTGTLTLVDSIANTRGYKASIKVNVKAAPVYTINVTGQPTFADQTEGYKSLEPQRVTISTTGNGDITNLAVALSGQNANSFYVTQPAATTLNSSAPSTVFTIKPKDGLKAGKYEAVVVITADNGVRESFKVSFTVNTAKSKDASLTALAVSQGEISFNPGNSAYSVTVPNGTAAVRVTFTAAPGAKTSVSSPQTVAITNGIGTFSVAVTAEDGVSKKEYIIKFKERVATPTASPESGVVEVGTKVILTTNTTGARIYYTTDASEPTTGSILYKGAISINEKAVIKAIAVKDGFPDSEVGVFSYSIQDVPITPIRNFTSTKITDTTADFSWTAATKAARLIVQQSTDKGVTWTAAHHAALAPDSTTVSVGKLTPSTSYKFKLVVTGGTNAGDSNIVDVTTAKKVDDQVYGASWTYGNSTKLTRIGKAEGKEPGKNFDTVAPWSGIKLCNVSDNGKITAYINDANFKRDGSNGQVMVKIPKFYYKHTYDDVNKVHEFWVAGKPTPGFKVHPCFLRDGVEKEYVLIGAYKAGFGKTQNGALDTLTSISGTYPVTSKTRAEFRTLVQARGTGWNQADVLTRNAIALLYLVEYADTDSQTAIGKGVVDSCRDVKSGGCDELNGVSGNPDVDGDGKTGKVSVSYRGMEDLWGGTWELMEGINIKNDERQPYIADGNFADDKFNGNYVPSGFTLPNEHGCMKNFGYSASADWLLMPSESGGGKNTYIPDYYYPGWWYAGDKVPYIGGNRDSGDEGGLFALFVTKTSAETTVIFSTRLQLIP